MTSMHQSSLIITESSHTGKQRELRAKLWLPRALPGRFDILHHEAESDERIKQQKKHDERHTSSDLFSFLSVAPTIASVGCHATIISKPNAVTASCGHHRAAVCDGVRPPLTVTSNEC
jgi:hypothetical protein